MLSFSSRLLLELLPELTFTSQTPKIQIPTRNSVQCFLSHKIHCDPACFRFMRHVLSICYDTNTVVAESKWEWGIAKTRDVEGNCYYWAGLLLCRISFCLFWNLLPYLCTGPSIGTNKMFMRIFRVRMRRNRRRKFQSRWKSFYCSKICTPLLAAMIISLYSLAVLYSYNWLYAHR